jgi:hypothetical protein
LKFYILDERDVWFEHLLLAARHHGFSGQRIFRGEQVHEPGYGFIRCHAEPAALKRNQQDWDMMSRRLTMIQDEAQVRLYEAKSAQAAKWGEWMPPTWRFTDHDSAAEFLKGASFPLVSKSDVGASSCNVWLLNNLKEAQAHIATLFSFGIRVKHCANNAESLQKDYVLLQQFIPHQITWRVNAVGSKRAAFMRYNYGDRPVAQTGNVQPVMKINPIVESLLEYCNRFFEHADTRWCAIDVLQDGDQWRLLETSLAWPWPSPGRCNDAPFFGTSKRWIDIFDVMFDEIEAGTWLKT